MALSFKIFSSLLAIILLNVTGVVNQQYAIGDKYYRPFTTEKVNWYRANHLCTAVGMQLASIETDSDLTILRQQLFNSSLLTTSYWLAGNNLADRGQYVWLSSGRKFSYTNWAPSQPGTLANRCVRTDYNFDWVSDYCSNVNYFICSRPAVPKCGIYGGCTENYHFIYPEK